mmetsp:Transcript_41982/g.70975  ORF Transcript_41982/g.70975 Transcript_41982/m.70975 type:complete len:91 (+) Transcript_41982:385-657(+)
MGGTQPALTIRSSAGTVKTFHRFGLEKNSLAQSSLKFVYIFGNPVPKCWHQLGDGKMLSLQTKSQAFQTLNDLCGGSGCAKETGGRNAYY